MRDFVAMPENTGEKPGAFFPSDRCAKTTEDHRLLGDAGV
jgi:hypothetical protein